MSTNYALEGQQAANKRRYIWWVVPGIFLPLPFSLAIPLLARVSTAPVPPASVLEEGPTGSTDQQVFIAAYVARAQARRMKKAWLGVALGVAWWGWIATSSLRAGLGTLGPALNPQPAVERTAGAAAGQEEVRRAQEAERRRAAEEARLAREAELRELIPARVAAIGELYDALAETHEEVARALADEWEQRWARDRAAMARFAKRQVLENIEATQEVRGLEGALGIADATYRSTELELADAREQLAQARTAAAAR